jgi:hypothetical protein
MCSYLVEANWATTAPKIRQPDTTPGDYTVAVSNITAAGYQWDGTVLSMVFTIQ